MLSSISFGKAHTFKKVTFQAYSAAITTEDDVSLVIENLNLNPKFASAKNKILAYRVN